MVKANPPPSAGTRRSSRLADQPETKKREAEDKPTGPASKKAKADSTKSGKKDSSKPAEPKVGKKAAEEKAIEAPAYAEPEVEDDSKALELGDKLPSLVLRDNEGKDVKVDELTAEKGVIIFLYPKADTPGCTTQACGFRDAFDEIAELGYGVYGLSIDEPKAQQRWKEKKQLNYKLLCDPQSILIKRLGAFVPPKNTKRSHFIFEKGSGKLVEAKLGVKPANDPKNCLEFIKAHQK